MTKIILASGSEGRKELFQQYFQDQFTIDISGVLEEDLNHLPPSIMVQELAKRKSQAIFQKYSDAVICAFDTTVSCENKSLGKPENIDQASDMLHFLNNKTQTVWTGYSIQFGDFHCFGVESADLILSLSSKEISAYITKHPVTKFAGAYAIQKEDTKVSIISGSIDTIIGAPMSIVISFLKEHNIQY